MIFIVDKSTIFDYIHNNKGDLDMQTNRPKGYDGQNQSRWAKDLTLVDRMKLYDNLPKELRDFQKQHMSNTVVSVKSSVTLNDNIRKCKALSPDSIVKYKEKITDRVRMSSKAVYGEDYPYEWSPW